MKIPLQNPSPSFEDFENVLSGRKSPEKVYFVELGVDAEVMDYIGKNYLEREWTSISDSSREDSIDQRIDFFYRLGYDFIQLGPDWKDLPEFKKRKAKDTAELSRGKREWIEEGGGIIKNWDDFEEIGWGDIEYEMEHIRRTAEKLPKGMKITVGSTLFEMILENFLGYEDLFKFSVKKPDLVEAIFQKWGQKLLGFYKEAIKMPEVGAIFHADDLGYKGGTLLSHDFLRENVFPWFKKFSSLAHENDKTYWYHCCGNVLSIMEDLIEDVNIDAFHSFQDVIIPVGESMEKYGDRIACLGGIDVDKLSRMNRKDLRKYVKNTLDECMPGRYALGSGNTVTNYVPPENYLTVLEEGMEWNNE